MTTRNVHWSLLTALALAGAAPGCLKKDPPRIDAAAVERCERGIERAETKATADEGVRIYDEECSAVYAEPLCRNAMADAAKVPREAQLPLIAAACRKAYCPILPSAGELDMCAKDFAATPESVSKSWPALNNAIIEFDGKALAPRITDAMLGFYLRTLSWPAPKSAAVVLASAAASADVPAPPSSASPGALPVPSAAPVTSTAPAAPAQPVKP